MPDNTTVFSKKGDLLQLGELVLPSDAQLKVNQSQVSGPYHLGQLTKGGCTLQD